MSFCSRIVHNNVDEKQSEHLTFATKLYTELNITSKLQIIQALDNGQCKLDIAREYGVQPQTITDICKQKHSLLKKYSQKYEILQQVSNLNLEQKLLHWFEEEFTNGNIIMQDNLVNKIEEILTPLNNGFSCIDDWLYSFLKRHNISKYTLEDVCDSKCKEEWKQFQDSSDTNDIYLGGVCALSHSLNVQSYLDGQTANSYVSLLFVVNTLGTHKREIAAVGNELLESETPVISLPVNYYYCVKSQVNYSVLVNYLTKWDNELSTLSKSVILVLTIPDTIIRKLHFNNIRIVNATNLSYVTKVLEKIIECFKYHYRRIQISRNITDGKDYCSFLDYLNLIGNAWHNVSQKYVKSLSLPPREGSLYFNVKQDNENDHSISRWCRLYNISLSTSPSLLDKYICCDKDLPCIYYDQIGSTQAMDVLSEATGQSTSGIDAYQAMKRLVSYLQGERAGGSIMKDAKYLENHIEYGALVQMHQIIGTKDST